MRLPNSWISALGAWGLVLLTASPSLAAEDPFTELSAEELDLSADRDLTRLKRYTRGVGRILQEIDQEKALFDRKGSAPLSADERRRVQVLFEQVLAHAAGLDSISRFHFGFWHYGLVDQPERHARHFALAYAAYTQKLRVALAFVDRTIGKRHFEVLLDEGDKTLGLQAGAYAKLKYDAVHVEDVARLVGAHQYHRLMNRTVYDRLKTDRVARFAVAMVDSNYPPVTKILKRHGVKLFSVNGFDILFDTGYRAWFPLQTQVAEWMGDTKVLRKDRMLISHKQVKRALQKSVPGDIWVERRNWYLSNLGLPGFWPHAALYVGTERELKEHFDDDAEVTQALGRPLTQVLKERFPSTWVRFTSRDRQGHAFRVIEAISEGVSFTTAEHSLDADYAAAVRPRLNKVEIARAIIKAFSYLGRPYDFDFDFMSDSTLVCSELVYKAYEPEDPYEGLRLPLESVIGRMTLPPNSMVRMYDENHAPGSDPQLDFVWFLDGREKGRYAIWADERAFRKSWERPKWDVAQK